MSIPPPPAWVPPVRLYLGTMTFGWSQASSYTDQKIATEIVRKFAGAHLTGRSGASVPVPVHVDTARIYSGGKSEKMTGAAVRTVAAELEGIEWRVGTKAHPSQQGGLSESGLAGQLGTSSAAVGLLPDGGSFSEYYLHQPDVSEPLSSSLAAASAHLAAGGAGMAAGAVMGLSNYHADEVRRAFELCTDASGGLGAAAVPAVYQGLYNPLNRMAEDELLPALREAGCAFVAYNPLAAGMLTGKYLRDDEPPPKGRFKDNPNYLPRFYTGANFGAVRIIRDALRAHNEALPSGGMPWTMVEATYGWLIRHSALGQRGDGLLIGASSVRQLDENLAACRRAGAFYTGPGGDAGEDLPEGILGAFEEAWEYVRANGEEGDAMGDDEAAVNQIFPYWRSYSADMPGREERNHGASYSASKK